MEVHVNIVLNYLDEAESHRTWWNIFTYFDSKDITLWCTGPNLNMSEKKGLIRFKNSFYLHLKK